MHRLACSLDCQFEVFLINIVDPDQTAPVVGAV